LEQQPAGSESAVAQSHAPTVSVDAIPDARSSAEAGVVTLHRDGLVGMPGAFGRARGVELAQDFARLFARALSYEGGTVDRGPNRHYFSVPAEHLRGFLPLVTTPEVVALSELVCGPDWQVVEVAFDCPRGGSVHQPWHRDFDMSELTATEHRLTSLAFNVTTVDVTPEMGPFEIAPGTQWDDGSSWPHGMFPPPEEWPRYESLRQQRLARLGDISARTGLAIHRGTPNVTDVDRGVLILGVVAPEDGTPEHHRLTMTSRYLRSLPPGVRRHLRVSEVDELPPQPRQAHDIEGLVMGVVPEG
jgi:hypothetical protein